MNILMNGKTSKIGQIIFLHIFSKETTTFFFFLCLYIACENI
jgi:hypothetical protein